VDLTGAQRRHLYLARDPRDQLVSYLHHNQLDIPKLNASAAEEASAHAHVCLVFNKDSLSDPHPRVLNIPSTCAAWVKEPKPMMQKEAAHPWCNHFVAWAALHHYWIMDKYSSEYPAQLVYYHR
jgi:hypothetical protein